MASPQKENGHIDIANEIAEALMRVNLSAYESRVLWFLFRKTYGWNKTVDWITLSQFSKCIGLDRRLVHRAIKGLSSKKMIVINRDDSQRLRYAFQKDYDKWPGASKKTAVIDTDDRVSSKEMTKLSSKEIPTNTTLTNTTLTKDKKILSGVPGDGIPYREIIEYLNQKTSKSFSCKNKKTKALIHARWNEGHALEHFKKVIENKCSQWLIDPMMINYLRPETLFGTKFESYLNEIVPSRLLSSVGSKNRETLDKQDFKRPGALT